jgi:hypothetical protein
VVNPALNARISWPWFIASQLGFGLFGGYVAALAGHAVILVLMGIIYAAILPKFPVASQPRVG